MLNIHNNSSLGNLWNLFLVRICPQKHLFMVRNKRFKISIPQLINHSKPTPTLRINLVH